MSDDRALVARLQNREEAAFREFVEKYKKMAFYLARDFLGNDLDAEDASQEAFMKVFSNIDTFRGESRFSSWFYRIVINCCCNKTRRKGYKAEQIAGEALAEIADTTADGGSGLLDPEQFTDARLKQKHITLALENLSQKQRIIFVLRFYHDLPIQEISEIAQCSAGTIKSQLFRTVRKLQKSLAFYRAELGVD